VISIVEVLRARARLFPGTGTWRSLASVIITLYYVTIIFHHRVWYRALSLCDAAMRVFEVQASSSSLNLPLCQISFLLQPPLLS